MCGIAGILPLSYAAKRVDLDSLRTMRQAIRHRGPDDQGEWISSDGSIGLAHQRLSIVDLSASGHQPMSNEDGSVWIAFNGEIYNHAGLRPALEKAGHRYASHTDTETILHAYEEYGTAAIDKLHGMFAFALWDERRRMLWLARDRMGKKPLYFAIRNGRLYFTSEIKALLTLPEFKPAVCEEALWHYLSFAATPAPLTLFEGIHKLPASTHLTITLGEDGDQWRFEEYWQPWKPNDAPPQSEEQYARSILDTLEKSVQRRLMSDVPFGVFLSGGVDSSANVALMSRHMDRPVNTFSVGFKAASQEPFNEIQHARRIAKLFKTNHHEVLIDDEDFLGFVDQLAFMQDEPLSDPVCFPLYFVSRLARQNGTIVIQVGEGSDEIFAGYEIYRNYLRRQTLYWDRFQAFPPRIREMILGAGEILLSPRHLAQMHRAQLGEPAFLGAALAFFDMHKENLKAWKDTYRSSALSHRGLQGDNPSMEMLALLYPRARCVAKPNPFHWESPDYLKRMIYWECRQRLPELLLMRLDKTMMAHSVEGRAPFLDTDLVELAMRIPSEMKIRDGIGKSILKKAVEPILPHDLIYRRKVGFCGGSGNMLTPAILSYAERKAMKVLPHMGWTTETLSDIFEAHREGSGENSFQIWNLMNLSLWYEKWF
jgi:asparagine synthase (glutamine-hydrolysing)